MKVATLECQQLTATHPRDCGVEFGAGKLDHALKQTDTSDEERGSLSTGGERASILLVLVAVLARCSGKDSARPRRVGSCASESGRWPRQESGPALAA